MALESLVRSLGDDATATELGIGVEVVLATDRAQSKARETLLAGWSGAAEAAAGGEAPREPVLWF